jgi:hypothetical protein
MRVSAQAFWAPKLGNQVSEYEDAFAPRPQVVGKVWDTCRFAIADGATETSFSGIWAKQLVRALCRGALDGSRFSEGLHAARERWSRLVGCRPLPWYAEEKIRSGAFAAIAGLTLADSDQSKDQGTWEVTAFGDSCVFQIREDRIISAFPFEQSGNFNNSPVLLGSTPMKDGSEPTELPIRCGIWRKGDNFYLMTDAIACWFLKELEAGKTPASELFRLSGGTKGSFEPWLSGLRGSCAVRNDDVTILKVEIEKD